MAQAERFLVDEHGKRVAVVLDVTEYERLLAQAEELEAIRAYDEAKATGDVAVPLEEALAQIEHRKR
jgi:PHD/YefM family antitoxin component YafN of YafNO toxin-antitoxin module